MIIDFALNLVFLKIHFIYYDLKWFNHVSEKNGSIYSKSVLYKMAKNQNKNDLII